MKLSKYVFENTVDADWSLLTSCYTSGDISDFFVRTQKHGAGEVGTNTQASNEAMVCFPGDMLVCTASIKSP